MQKKPTVYVVVIVPIFVIGGIFVSIGVDAMYRRMVGISLNSAPGLKSLLISLPFLFLWIPLALFLANCVLFVVPPLRKIANTYAAEAKRPSFLESQKQLGKFALIMALICIPLIILGFML